MLGEELETFEFDFEPFDVEIPTFDFDEFIDVDNNWNQTPSKTEYTVQGNTPTPNDISSSSSSSASNVISSQNLGESSEAISDDVKRTNLLNEHADALFKKFAYPPFTVLDTRNGVWNEKKKLWNRILNSQNGRDDNLVYSGLAERAREYNIASSSTATNTSVFDPVLTEILYQWFCPENGRVLDPFAGGVTRGAIAGILGRQYIGVDLSQKQIDENLKTNKIIKSFLDSKEKNYVEPQWICDDAMNVSKHIDNMQKFDFILSCPPYHDLEKYSDSPLDLSNLNWDNFITKYRKIFKDCVSYLNDDSFVVVVVSEIRDKRDKNGKYKNFVGETISALQDAGTDYYNDMVLVNQIGSLVVGASVNFRYRKVTRVHQNVLIFLKGDAKKACAKLNDRISEFTLEE